MSVPLFDFEIALARSLSAQKTVIAAKAQAAVDRLYWMHAVGSGICGCGGDMHDHPIWDNHGPVEIPIDKSAWADPTKRSDCDGRGAHDFTYDDPFRGPGQTGWEACGTCGGRGWINPTDEDGAR